MNSSPPSSAPASSFAALRRLGGARVLGRMLVVGWIVLASLALLLRYVGPLLIEHHQEALVARVGSALGAVLEVERVEAGWQGWRPQLNLQEVRVRSEDGTEAFVLGRIDAGLSAAWWRGALQFTHLEISAAQLSVVRDQDGRIHLAGFAAADGRGAQPHAGIDWLLAQSRLSLRETTLIWDDRLQAQPPLRLENLSLQLSQAPQGAVFNVQGPLPAVLGQGFELRVALTGALPARLDDWRQLNGEVFLALESARLAAWQQALALPGMGAGALSGEVSARVWLRSGRGNASGGGGDLGRSGGLGSAFDGQLDIEWLDGRVALAEGQPASTFSRLAGQVEFSHEHERLSLRSAGLSLLDEQGEPLLAPTALEVVFDPARPEDGGKLALEALELGALPRLAALLPPDTDWQQQLAGLAPQGRLEQASFAWRRGADGRLGWQVAGRVRGLALQAWQQWPALSGFSAVFAGNEERGRYLIESSDFAVALPAVFSAGPLAFDRLHAAGSWQREAGGWKVTLAEASLHNADLSGTAAGHYRLQDAGGDRIELEAELSRARGDAVWRYLPEGVGEHTRQWVRAAVRAATVNAARLRLHGALADFPFREGKGEFRVDVEFEDGVLAYAEGWPQIDDIAATLSFAGPGLRIEAERGRIFGVGLEKVVVDIAELDTTRSDLMRIEGEARGATADFLRFITASPVSASIGGLTDHIEARGQGGLQLRLEMPLRTPEETTLAGTYRFERNRLLVAAGLPALDNASGVLHFTERGIDIPAARARFLGGETRLAARTGEQGVLQFALDGEAQVDALQAFALPPGRASTASALITEQLSGALQWSAALRLDGRSWTLELASDLLGVASALPAPLAKRADQRWPLRVDLRSAASGGESVQQLGLSVALAGPLGIEARARWSAAQPVQAALALGSAGAAPPLPARGLAFRLGLDELDGEAWQRLLEAAAGDEATASGFGEAWLPLQAELDIARLHSFGIELRELRAGLRAEAGGWQAEVDSDRIAGRFSWLDTGSGALHARLDKLVLGDASGATGSTAGDAAALPGVTDEIEPPPRQLPALDIIAARFVLRGMELGRLQLAARNRAGLWLLDELSLSNPDARLQGSGRWHTTGDPRSELDFTLTVDNVGRLFRRLGQEDVIRAGKATLDGELGWRGGPTHLHYPSLGGRFSLGAESGQFNRLEPGVGRFLGILSLQALPRRITLDFRDVFSAGFAFDGISGSMTVDKGVMRSDNFTINGPAARISMQGWTDLQSEAQHLRVLVQPTLSESVALGAGAALVNPVAGIVTYLAQKALSDPIEKLFAYEYEISGSWSDPVVRRVGQPPAKP